MWNKDRGYQGTLLDFLEYLVSEMHPSPKSLALAQNWILSELNQGIGPFPIRHTRSIRQRIARDGPNKPRYYFQSDGLPYDLIATDNEATSSFYHQVLRDRFTVENSMLGSLQDFLCVGILRTGTPKSERDEFVRKKIKATMYAASDRLSFDGLKLCHILGAAGELPEHLTLEGEIRQRVFRTLCPLNVFPFPFSSSGSQRLKYAHLLDGHDRGDLGEYLPVQRTFEAVVMRKLERRGQLEVFCDWVKLSQPEIGIDDKIARCRQVLNQMQTAVIEITPFSPLPPRTNEISATNETPVAAIVEEAAAITDFCVTETDSGRFHFAGFGVAIGGQNRNKRFVIVVKDRNGRAVARSNTVTASELGIAARGRVDYDKNGFHQTDFFVRDATGEPQPNSAIARRVDWKLM